MPRYGDDQCHRCGGIRAAGSTLCVSCLVKQLAAEKRERAAAESVTRSLRAKISDQAAIINDLLEHGFKQNQKTTALIESRDNLMELLNKEKKDEESGV